MLFDLPTAFAVTAMLLRFPNAAQVVQGGVWFDGKAPWTGLMFAYWPQAPATPGMPPLQQ